MPKIAHVNESRKAYEKVVRELFPDDAIKLLMPDRDRQDERLNDQETRDLLQRFAH